MVGVLCNLRKLGEFEKILHVPILFTIPGVLSEETSIPVRRKMIATTKANVFNFIGFILEKVRANSQIRFGYDVICLSLFVTKLDSCKKVPVTERKRLILPCYVLNAKRNIQYYSNSQTRLLQEERE